MTSGPLLFYGPFPGPVTGQTVMTRFLHEALVSRGIDVVTLDSVRGNTSSRWRNTAVRITRFLRAARSVIFSRSASACYVSLDANVGMIATLLVVAAARLRGLRTFVHHHTYSHIGAPSRLFRLLCRVSAGDTTHIVICDTMRADLRSMYPEISQAVTLSNACSIEPSEYARRPLNDRPIVLGHLSNLSFAKGIREAVETACLLNARGTRCELHFAGPVAPGAHDYLEAVAAEHEFIRWVGPVYGNEKSRFFEQIDIFVFPTKYPNETQGIVNLEALASGVPVIAFDRCCIGDDLKGLDGWAVPVGDDFAHHTVSMIEDLDHRSLGELRSQAIERFTLLRSRAGEELDALILHIAGRL